METSLSFSDEIPVFVRLGKMAAYSALTPQQQIKISTARIMKSKGYPLNEIAEILGLSISQIQSL